MPAGPQYPRTDGNHARSIGMGMLDEPHYSYTTANQASCVRTGITGRRHCPRTDGNGTQYVGMGMLSAAQYSHITANRTPYVGMGIPDGPHYPRTDAAYATRIRGGRGVAVYGNSCRRIEWPNGAVCRLLVSWPCLGGAVLGSLERGRGHIHPHSYHVHNLGPLGHGRGEPHDSVAVGEDDEQPSAEREEEEKDWTSRTLCD